MRWTRHVIRRMTEQADGEVVWFWRPDAGAKSRRHLSCEVTVAKEPGHREDHV